MMKVTEKNEIPKEKIEDVVIEEVKIEVIKQEKNIMTEDDDDDDDDDTNSKDKRLLRKPNEKVTRHHISIIKGLDFGF